MATILNFVELSLLLKVDWNFAYEFFAAILNWNFRLQTSNFRDH